MRRLLPVMLAALLLAALPGAPARAELWVSTAGALLKGARSIELVHITTGPTAAAPDEVTGTIIKSIRGRKVGLEVTVPLLRTGAPVPAKGMDLLVICDHAECPRAQAVDSGGWFLLDAQEPMDGAWVLPGLVELASLDALAAGQPAPDLCLRPTVRFLDAPARPKTFRVTIDAATGAGTVAAGALAKDALKASLRLEDAWRTAGQAPALHLGVVGKKAGVTFLGGPITRAQDGCFEATVMPVEPLARTAAALTRVLAGKGADTVIAKGTFHIDAGTVVKHKDYAVKVVVDKHGQVRLDSPLFATKSVTISSINMSKTVRLGFAWGGDYEKLIVLDLGAAQPPVPGAGAGMLMAAALRAGGRTTEWPVVWYDLRAQPQELPIGRVRLSYVADTGK